MEINAQVSKLQMWLLKTEEANPLLSSLHASSNYREQHSLTHHFFLISRFLFLLTKKRKNNFFLKSNNIQEGNLTIIKIFF